MSFKLAYRKGWWAVCAPAISYTPGCVEAAGGRARIFITFFKIGITWQQHIDLPLLFILLLVLLILISAKSRMALGGSHFVAFLVQDKVTG